MRQKSYPSNMLAAPISSCWRMALGALLLALSAAPSQAGFVTFEGTGIVPAVPTAARDAFRVAIGGGAAAGANGSFGGVRREINWDGVPDTFADPNALPANFFNSNSPRGAVFSTPGTGFRVSANAGQFTPILFGFPDNFQTFSAQRLFTAINSNITDVSFFVPGTATQASTSAFGLIFTDVEVADQTKLEFFDLDNLLIYTHSALVSGNHGLSFVGAVAASGEKIGRVRITSGLGNVAANGGQGGPNEDLVAMDDFLYAEPVAAPARVAEPGSMVLAALGLCAMGWRCRRVRNRL